MAAMEMAASADLQRRVALLHRLAWICAVLVLAITSLSAFVRLSKAGVGCEPWPQCQAQRTASVAAGMPVTSDAPAVTGARMAHRVAASSALLVIIAMLMIALARQPAIGDAGRFVLALLALALFLAVLGRVATNTPVPGPAVALGNLLGGMGMVGVVWHLVRITGPRAGFQVAGPPRAWVLGALAWLALQMALGAVVSAGQLAAQCDASLTCNAHRIVGLVTVFVLAGVAKVAWRTRPRRAGVLLLLVLAQAALGVAMLALGLTMPLALAHNVLMALLILTLVSLL